MYTFFVYDTLYCKSDEDDPKDAVIYFFPQEVSEKIYLCGQLVGVARFCKSTFSEPSIIVLEQEKFAFQWHGKYLLVLGSNSYIHENVLKRHLSFLCGIFCFYHGSMEIMCNSTVSRSDFMMKMDLTWSRFFHFIQCFDNFLQIPAHSLPLTSLRRQAQAEHQAKQFLQKCQISSSVVAGAVLCNGRVLYSQFIPEVTSYLTLLSNANASITVKNVEFKKILPPDVELKYVYLNKRTYCNIVKYNHTSAGSAVRIKQCANICGQQHNPFDVVSSGSEGDIDSGNDCHNDYLHRTDSKFDKFFFHALDCKSQTFCCVTHENIFKKNLRLSRNSVLNNYSAVQNINRNEMLDDYYVSSGNKFQNFAADPTNLLCFYHADYFASNCSVPHLDAISSCDMEFCCYFCINYSHFWSSPFLKSWNSSMQIPVNFSASRKLFIFHKQSSCCKIQVLKCRSKRCKKKNTSSKRLSNESNSAGVIKRDNMSCNVCNVLDIHLNVEKNDLERQVLYVQRCGGNTFLLLLRKKFDENILSFLWDSILTFLKRLDSNALWYEKYNEKDWLNITLLSDNKKKTIKEYPLHHGHDQYVQELVQTIQEDFTTNSKIQAFLVMSNNVNVSAVQKKCLSAFYISKDISSRKVDSLCSLSKKASHKLEKYLKFPH